MTIKQELRVAQKEISKLTKLVDSANFALKLVATGIWRNKEMNACGLAGAAVVVHEVERCLAEIEDYIEDK